MRARDVRQLRHRRRGGFTLVELSIGVVILLLLAGTLMQSMTALSRGATFASINAELQAQADRSIRAIVDDLKRSGFAALGGNAFPNLFLDGNAQGFYAASAHAPAVHHAVAGDPDFGPNREIVFLLPADADADGRPDINGAGAMVWGAAQHAFVVVTRPDGVNVLERRRDGLAPRLIARYVERVTFDDNATSGFQVPLDAIRARIWFRRVDERGAVHRFFAEAVVNLRNG